MVTEYDRQYAAKNAERIREQRRAYRATPFYKANAKDWAARYRATHREAATNYSKKYCADGKNKERMAQYLDSRRKSVPEVHYKMIAANSRKYRAKLMATKQKLVDLLGGCCRQCSMTDVRVLDFDHTDPSTKTFSLTRAAMNKPWEVLIAEAAKCQLLCANCHRIKTIENGDWSNRRGLRKFHVGSILERGRL